MSKIGGGVVQKVGGPHPLDPSVVAPLLIPERYGQTGRQTDGQICYINIARHGVSMLTRDKNRVYARLYYDVQYIP